MIAVQANVALKASEAKIVLLEVLDQVEKCFWHDEVESPVEAGGDAHSLTAKPERINLR